jgi:hypothetical protein
VRRCTKRAPEKRVTVATRTAVTTEARPASKSGERYARMWLILSLQAGMLLVLLGASPDLFVRP